MFRYVAILLFVVGILAFLWPTIVEGSRIARDKFRKMHADPQSTQPEDKQ